MKQNYAIPNGIYGSINSTNVSSSEEVVESKVTRFSTYIYRVYS